MNVAWVMRGARGNSGGSQQSYHYFACIGVPEDGSGPGSTKLRVKYIGVALITSRVMPHLIYLLFVIQKQRHESFSPHIVADSGRVALRRPVTDVYFFLYILVYVLKCHPNISPHFVCYTKVCVCVCAIKGFKPVTNL